MPGLGDWAMHNRPDGTPCPSREVVRCACGWVNPLLAELDGGREAIGAARDENGVALTDAERRAIMALHRLAKRWPATLTLVSMESNLEVIRTGDPRFHDPDLIVRQEAVIQTIHGIPNDGGGW